jgi:hypothetical protein
MATEVDVKREFEAALLEDANYSLQRMACCASIGVRHNQATERIWSARNEEIRFILLGLLLALRVA